MGQVIIAFTIAGFLTSLIQFRRRIFSPIKKGITIFFLVLSGIAALCSLAMIFRMFMIGGMEMLVGLFATLTLLALVLTSPKIEE